MFCTKCGNKIINRSAFCPGCGVKLETIQEVIISDPVCSSCGEKLVPGNQFCIKCGTKVNTEPVFQAVQNHAQTAYAPYVYNAAQETVGDAGYHYPPGYMPKNKTTALLLCIFTAVGHRFYTGKIGTAILMLIVILLTVFFMQYLLISHNEEYLVLYLYIIFHLGYLFWWIIDLVRIGTGIFTDKQGFPLKKN